MFNSQGWSGIYQDLPLYGDSQYEGFAYLGAGGILLAIFSVILFFTDARCREITAKNRCVIVGLVVVLALSLCFALSPVITVNDRVLAEIPCPRAVEELWGIFRYTGRCGWVLFYTLSLCFCVMLHKVSTGRTAAAALILCVLVQGYDLRGNLREIHEKYDRAVTYETVYDNEFADFWDPVGDNGRIRHIVFASPVSGVDLYAMADWAFRHDKTINTFYFARDYDGFEDNLEEALAHPNEAELFLFPKSQEWDFAAYDLHYYLVDDYIVGYAGTLRHWPRIDYYN